MKKIFSEYNRLGDEAIKNLWENALFVFDTNVLLNLYRYSDETSNIFLETISDLKERVWLPYHVGFEFNKNRLNVISDQKKNYRDFEKKINEIIGDVEDSNRNPFLSKPLFKKLKTIIADIKHEVDVKIETYNSSFTNDMLLEKINCAFDGKVGNVASKEQLQSIFNEGMKRYLDKIPPGYCDSKKPESERYSDLIIWKQIMLKSRETNSDIIFILDDNKEDWWLEQDGMTISPRPELLKEFKQETKQQCHFYKPFQFLNYSKEYLGQTIKMAVIEEVKNYKQEILINDKFIQINLTLKGSIEDLIALVQDMKDAGYNIFAAYSKTTDVHEVFVLLPNIPDLERRLNSKYISNLRNYNIKLIETIQQ